MEQLVEEYGVSIILGFVGAAVIAVLIGLLEYL